MRTRRVNGLGWACMSKIQGVCGSPGVISDSYGSLYDLKDNEIQSVGGWFDDWMAHPILGPFVGPVVNPQPKSIQVKDPVTGNPMTVIQDGPVTKAAAAIGKGIGSGVMWAMVLGVGYLIFANESKRRLT